MTPQNVANFLQATRPQGADEESKGIKEESRSGADAEIDFGRVYTANANKMQENGLTQENRSPEIERPRRHVDRSDIDVPNPGVVVLKGHPETQKATPQAAETFGLSEKRQALGVTPKDHPDVLKATVQTGGPLAQAELGNSLGGAPGGDRVTSVMTSQQKAVAPAALVVAEQVSSAAVLPDLTTRTLPVETVQDFPSPLISGKAPETASRGRLLFENSLPGGLPHNHETVSSKEAKPSERIVPEASERALPEPAGQSEKVDTVRQRPAIGAQFMEIEPARDAESPTPETRRESSTDLPRRSEPASGTGAKAADAAFTAPKAPEIAVAQPQKTGSSAVLNDLPEILGADLEPVSRSETSAAARATVPRPVSAVIGTVLVQIQSQSPVLAEGHRIHIRLDPPDLGSFEVRLELSDQTVRAVVATERADTLDLLTRHRSELIAILRDSGFDVTDAQFEQAGEGELSGSKDEDPAFGDLDSSDEPLVPQTGNGLQERISTRWDSNSDRLDIRV